MSNATYTKTSPNIAPAAKGSAGNNDVTSGMQLATANGTIGAYTQTSPPTNLSG